MSLSKYIIIINSLFIYCACQPQVEQLPERMPLPTPSNGIMRYVAAYSKDTSVVHKYGPLFNSHGDTLKAFDLAIRVQTWHSPYGSAVFLDLQDSMMYDTQQFSSIVSEGGFMVLDTIDSEIIFNDLYNEEQSSENGLEDWINKRFWDKPITQENFVEIMDFVRCHKNKQHTINYLDTLIKKYKTPINTNICDTPQNKQNLYICDVQKKILHLYQKHYVKELYKMASFIKNYEKKALRKPLVYIAQESGYIYFAMLTMDKYPSYRFTNKNTRTRYTLIVKYICSPEKIRFF